MYPQFVIMQYGQYLAMMYVASLFNPAYYYSKIFSSLAADRLEQHAKSSNTPLGEALPKAMCMPKRQDWRHGTLPRRHQSSVLPPQCSLGANTGAAGAPNHHH